LDAAELEARGAEIRIVEACQNLALRARELLVRGAYQSIRPRAWIDGEASALAQ
jgi:hypothetical protein